MSDTKRKEIEAAMAVLESQRSVLGDAVVTASINALQAQLADLAPAPQQRKLVTVLFMDIASSTSMVRDLDPEDNMAIMDTALQRLSAPVGEHGGHITRYMGDGFKAVFGAPVARENDPEMAVRAGLGILAAAREYAQQVEAAWGIRDFRVRVGINTGLAVIGGYSEAEDTIMGTVVNLAARVESAAQPGTMLISHDTYQHIRGLFEVAAHDPIQAKGFPEPVPVYRVVREKAHAFRMHQRGVEGLETRTVGRDQEMRALQAAYQAAAGQAQTNVITLVGEAGVGKSRLVYEFNRWLALQPQRIGFFKGRASQQTQGIPRYLLRDMLAGRFQIQDSDPRAAMREKFTAGIEAFLPTESELKAAILGTWLGYDFSDSPHLQAIKDDPQQIKNRATLYLAQLFKAAAEQNPVVILLDDIHWADGGSLEAIADLARRQPELTILVVCISRPSLYENRPSWGENLPAHTRLELAPLSREDTRALVSEILRKVDPIPQVLLDLITSRAEGNPFYAEELVKMLIDDGLILTGEAAWVVDPEKLPALKVPDTLVEVLQARLDRLSPGEKQTAQQAAVIGRVFWDKALEALQGDGPQALPALQTREFIFPRVESTFEGTAEYIFKHALLRDVTYETVLKRVRMRYHALIADWLKSAANAKNRSDEYSALIGEHYHLADALEKAAGWYGRAGKQAAATYAYDEALHYLSLALAFTPAGDHAERFSLFTSRAKVLGMQGDRAAQRKDLDQIATLATDLGEPARIEATLLQAHYAEATGDYPQAVDHVKTALAWGQDEMPSELAVEAHLIWGQTLWRQGAYPDAQVQYQTSVRLAQQAGDQKRQANGLNGLGVVADEQGDLAAARTYFAQALTINKEIDNRVSVGRNLTNLGNVACDQGDFAAGKVYYEESLEIIRETGDRLGEGITLLNLGLLARDQGDYSAAEGYFQQSLAIRREVGDRKGEGWCLGGLGGAVRDQGDYSAAAVYFEQALEIAHEIGERYGEGRSYQELGEVALAQNDLALAERRYQQSLSIHEELNQRQYLVDDWAGLARLKLAQGNHEDARAYGEQTLGYLQENPRLDGTGSPMRTFRFTWETLLALDEADKADEVLSLAAAVIQDYLDKNTNPEVRAMYLRQPHHATLWAAWGEKGS